MDIIKIKKLEKKLGSPFYVLNIRQYEENLSLFKAAFLKRYPRLIVGYSFKTNYLPPLCYAAKKQGVFAEVVSRFEYDLALKLGFKDTSIIFNGPVKKKEDIYRALDNESIINLDSYQEVDAVISYKKDYPQAKIKIGLRVNISLKDNDGNSHIQCGLREGRFGFSKEEISRVVNKLSDSDISIISLHGHTSSSDRAVENYTVICEQLLSVAKINRLNEVRYFNVGGGFFGAAPKGVDISNKPTYNDYANQISEVLLSDSWFNKVQPYIVIEPGVSVVANTLSFISKIHEIKKINDKKFIIIDGSIYDIKPTMHTNNLPHKVIFDENINISREVIIADVVGSTCMEKDIVLKDIKAECAVGDYIQFDGIGAYSVVMTPTFINTFSPIVVLEEEKYKVIRRRQTLEDFLSVYNLE